MKDYENWCLIVREGISGHTLARWSKTHYAWIGIDLVPICRFNEVEEVFELTFKYLSEILYPSSKTLYL